jgi:hypothetical protein
MTSDQWIQMADKYELQADAAFAAGDEILGEVYSRKALACRHNACYGTEEGEEE